MKNPSTSKYLVEQVTQLHKQALGALVATLVVVAYVVYMLYGVVPEHQVFAWVGLLIAINVYLLVWIALVSRRGVTESNARRYLYAYQVEAILHGLAWGLLPFMLMEAKQASMQFFAYYVLCGMAAGAIATTGMIYRIYISYMLPMMLPGIVIQLIGGDYQLFDNSAIGLLIIFVIAMLSLSFTHYESVMKSIALAFNNDELVEKLTVAIAKAEEANLAKSRFLANMSHELRTPLNAVIGYGEIIEDDARDGGANSIANDASKIIVAGRHLLKLIDDILNLSKIEAGREELQLTDINLPDLINGLLPTVRRLASVNHNELGVNIDMKVGTMHSDAIKVQQIIANLLSNAVKFTHAGRVALSVTPVSMDGKGGIRFVIEDNGIGMTEEQLSMLYQTFRQADDSTTRKYGGVGLGMAITRFYVDMLGGTINVHSRSGLGTRIEVILPQSTVLA